MPNWLQLIIVLVVLATIAGIGLALLLAPAPPENRPAPPERLADLERARDEALQKIAERARRQERREADLECRDVDIARRDQPRRPVTRRDIEARRASSYLSRGF